MKCNRQQYQLISQAVQRGVIVEEIKECEACGRTLRIAATGSSNPATSTGEESLPSNVLRFPAASAITASVGLTSAGADFASNATKQNI